MLVVRGRRDLSLAAIKINAPQHGPHACLDFTDAKGLADIVIGPHFQAQNTIYFFIACSKHDDGCEMILPDTAADREAIQSRQHPIQDDQLGVMLLNQTERYGAVKSLKDSMTLSLQFA